MQGPTLTGKQQAYARAKANRRRIAVGEVMLDEVVRAVE